MRDRLATELAEEREARLQQMRDRLAAESVEEKESRLQQMSTRQRERLATESAEEREARLYHMHGQHAYSGHVIKCLLMYDHCRFAKLAP